MNNFVTITFSSNYSISDDVVVALTNSGFVKVWTIGTVTVKVTTFKFQTRLVNFCLAYLVTVLWSTYSQLNRSTRRKPNRFDA